MRQVEFKTVLQRGNRIQVPRLIRWQFRLDPAQVLEVRVQPVEMIGRSERFYAQMSRDGRITIPRLVVSLLSKEDINLIGRVMQVTLQPTEEQA